MKTHPQHTPTPWVVSYGDTGNISRIRAKSNGNPIAKEIYTEDAEFIVRAVNAHEELVFACKEALRRGEFHFNGHEDDSRVEDLLKQVIAKAEGK